MRQLLAFLQSYYYVFLFFLLEIIALYFLLARNDYQKAKFLNSTSVIQTSIDKQRSEITNYFGLKENNIALAKENKELLEQLVVLKQQIPQAHDSLKIDSTAEANFNFQLANVISKSMTSSYTHITLDKGSAQGVKVKDGVIANGGIIGKVVKVDKNHALVMPIFHPNSKLNIKHLPSKYTGNLIWSGKNFSTITAEKVPRNASIEKGDTIVTNQYSKSFPIGTGVGVVSEINYDSSGDFYQLGIQPFAEFDRLGIVYLAQRKDLEEIEKLEEQQ